MGGPALIRLVGGIPDPSFGSAGIAFHPMPYWWSTYPGHGVFDLASTPDGGYVIVGLVQQPQYLYQIVVVKFTATGQIDRAFGAGGVAPLKLAQPGDHPPSAANLAVQSDGRIVVASTLVDVVEGSFVSLRVGLGRLTVSGQPDPQFAAAGVKSLWVERGTSAKFVSVRPDGRIVVVGELYPPPVGGVYQQSAVFQFLGGNSTRIRPLGERLAIEYYHGGFGHYFLSADPHEVMNLDGYNPNGWARTGYAFRVWNDDDPSLAPACRFWSQQSFAPKSSHFYTPYPAECAALKAGNTWGFERNAFDLRMPGGTPGSRVCPTDSRPLYRVYNNGLGGAPNHRYTSERGVLDEMVSKGWTMEGEAQTQVFACVPAE